MGNNSMCSCKNSDINTESSIIREDKNRNDLLKKSRSEATFNSVLEKKSKKENLISNIISPCLKEIALNNYAKNNKLYKKRSRKINTKPKNL